MKLLFTSEDKYFISKVFWHKIDSDLPESLIPTRIILIFPSHYIAPSTSIISRCCTNRGVSMTKHNHLSEQQVEIIKFKGIAIFYVKDR